MQDVSDFEQLRLEILEASLRHVPFDGWTERALSLGAKDVGANAAQLAHAFPRGGRDLFRVYTMEADLKMAAVLEESDIENMRIRDKITLAVRIRLEQNVEHREASRRAMAYLLQPAHTGEAAASVWRTIDTIWYAIGDRSSDFNFYSKRGLLAAVYISTFFTWLNDDSKGFTKTWSFLDQRIADVMKVPKIRGQAEKAFSHIVAVGRQLLNRGV